MFLVSVSLIEVVKHLSMVKKRYRKSKYFESKASKNAAIKKAIDWHMDNFCSDKRLIIKSILDCPFCKIVLDYLVVDDELVVKPDKVKLKVNEIMERWTRKQTVLPKMSVLWSCQYMLLDHIPDNAFSGVIKEINMNELLLCVNNLSNNKAARLSGIPNEL
ncbi:hypothetical protein G9A89_008536 [Geosiphon pyriformis]|nr:hypothetical protein G9A89_008536 [Geosiphon pyriformis]